LAVVEEYARLRDATDEDRPLSVPKARKEEKGMSTAGAIIRGEGEGERRWFAGGGVHVMKATAEETDGRSCCSRTE